MSFRLDEKKRAVRTYLEKGESMRATAERFGISHACIQRWMDKMVTQRKVVEVEGDRIIWKHEFEWKTNE